MVRWYCVAKMYNLYLFSNDFPDFSTLLSIYNNTKGIPTISNQTSLIPGLVTALQRLEEKLVTMETKLDNCTSKSTTCTEPPTTQAPTTTSAPTTTAAPTTTSAPTTRKSNL